MTTCTWCAQTGHDFRAHLTSAYAKAEERFNAAHDAWVERYPESVDAVDQAEDCAAAGHPERTCVPLCKRLAGAAAALEAATGKKVGA